MKTKQIEEKSAIDLNEKEKAFIHDLRIRSWVEDGPDIKETLMMFARLYIMSEEVYTTEERRGIIAYHLYTLEDLINDLMQLELSNNKTDHSDPDPASPGESSTDHKCLECLKKEGIIDLLEQQLAAKEERIKELCLEIGHKKNCKTLSLK